jgi:hypothetical protein
MFIYKCSQFGRSQTDNTPMSQATSAATKGFGTSVRAAPPEKGFDGAAYGLELSCLVRTENGTHLHHKCTAP